MIFLQKRKVRDSALECNMQTNRFNTSAKNTNVRVSVALWSNLVTFAVTYSFLFLSQGMENFDLMKKLLVDYFSLSTELSVIVPIVFFAENRQVLTNVVGNLLSR